ncbi:MAG TPA: GspMb/PilO family protein, partial [Candidatus Angelobacter sp.]|nr:GspMb/PilO family protein [Candidatus Angelobacter sp.]
MNNLVKMRQRFTLILSVLGALDLLLIIYLLLPGSSPSSRTALEQNLRDQEKALNRQVAPLKGIDKQLAQTRVDVKNFYAQKVPSQFSEISQHLEKLMKDTGVTTTGGRHYVQENRGSRNEKGDLPDVQRIDIDTTVTGEYAKVARFINALEQDKFVFIIDTISLTSQESGVVSLQIKFETFLKE